eukprot:66489-Chlamydomonas_euryale.AAC.2
MLPFCTCGRRVNITRHVFTLVWVPCGWSASCRARRRAANLQRLGLCTCRCRMPSDCTPASAACQANAGYESGFFKVWGGWRETIVATSWLGPCKGVLERVDGLKTAHPQASSNGARRKLSGVAQIHTWFTSWPHVLKESTPYSLSSALKPSNVA